MNEPTKLENLKCFNMEMIQGIPWAESMFETLIAGLKKSFLNWVQVALTLSQNEEDVLEWTSTFIEQFEERCCELVSDIEELHTSVILNIEKYLNRTQVLCKTLQKEMPVFGNLKLGLYQEQFQLKKTIKELEQMVEDRQSELNVFRKKQSKLCQILGKDPKIIKDNPLPSSNEILDIQKYIEELEQEKFDREEKFYTVKEKLVELINELEYIPCTKFEKEVIYGDESKFLLTESNMAALDSFHTNVQKESHTVKQEICSLRNKIEQLWMLLDLDFIEREKFRETYVGNSLKTLDALRKELQRCEQLKKANIKVFIDKLRKELEEIWKKCHCAASVKEEFKYFYSDCYTEDLMELHEVQIDKWRIYAEENRDILALLNKHKTLWEKLTQLDHSAMGRERLNNRGGKLLIEERERKLLDKQIPKIERNLLDLAERYESRHGMPFLTFGQSVTDYINNLHAERENAKKLRLSARKAQQKTPMSSSKCFTSLFPSSSHLTPRKPQESSSTRVRKLKLCSLSEPPNKKKRHPAVLACTINRTKRLSTEKERIEKIRRRSRSIKMIEENSSMMEENASYKDFQVEITERGSLRSTLNFNVAPGSSKD